MHNITTGATRRPLISYTDSTTIDEITWWKLNSIPIYTLVNGDKLKGSPIGVHPCIARKL